MYGFSGPFDPMLRGRARTGETRSAGGFQDIISQMQAAQEKANLLNEQRYRQILAQYENLGQAGRARIEEQTTQRQAEARQGLVSRGLGGTTITSAVERGIGRESELARQQLEESVAVQRAGVMERRTDVGPDLGMFANLLQAAGQQQQQPRAVSTVIGPGGPGTPWSWERGQAAVPQRRPQAQVSGARRGLKLRPASLRGKLGGWGF